LEKTHLEELATAASINGAGSGELTVALHFSQQPNGARNDPYLVVTDATFDGAELVPAELTANTR
jgi:hypothetical protein